MLICDTVENCPYLAQCWLGGQGYYDVTTTEDRARGDIRIASSMEGCSVRHIKIKKERLKYE